MRTVFFDLETGGLDTERSPIIQIAALATEGSSVIEEFEAKLQFNVAAADPKALELNSYNPDEWASSAVPPRDAMDALTAFLKRHATVEMVSQRTGKPYHVAQLAGHNAARFDGPMLQSWYRRADQFLPASFMVLDTLQLAMWACRLTGDRPENMKLGTLAAHFGCECGEAHDALSDVKTAHAVACSIGEVLNRNLKAAA